MNTNKNKPTVKRYSPSAIKLRELARWLQDTRREQHASDPDASLTITITKWEYDQIYEALKFKASKLEHGIR